MVPSQKYISGKVELGGNKLYSNLLNVETLLE